MGAISAHADFSNRADLRTLADQMRTVDKGQTLFSLFLVKETPGSA